MLQRKFEDSLLDNSLLPGEVHLFVVFKKTHTHYQEQSAYSEFTGFKCHCHPKLPSTLTYNFNCHMY